VSEPTPHAAVPEKWEGGSPRFATGLVLGVVLTDRCAAVIDDTRLACSLGRAWPLSVVELFVGFVLCLRR